MRTSSFFGLFFWCFHEKMWHVDRSFLALNFSNVSQGRCRLQSLPLDSFTLILLNTFPQFGQNLNFEQSNSEPHFWHFAFIIKTNKKDGGYIVNIDIRDIDC